MHGTIETILICASAGDRMNSLLEVMALEGKGLQGDRYCKAQGSFNKGEPGKRQVTFINSTFLKGTGFTAHDSRRNIVTTGIELMNLIGEEFQIGGARFRGLKHCYPCERPSHLMKSKKSFKEAFSDRGGLVAEITQSGMIKVGQPITLVTP